MLEYTFKYNIISLLGFSGNDSSRNCNKLLFLKFSTDNKSILLLQHRMFRKSWKTYEHTLAKNIQKKLKADQGEGQQPRKTSNHPGHGIIHIQFNMHTAGSIQS